MNCSKTLNGSWISIENSQSLFLTLVFIDDLISEGHVDSLGLEEQSGASPHNLLPSPPPPSPCLLPPLCLFPSDTRNTGVAPSQPQLLWLLSCWQWELGCWQLLLPRVPTEREMPGVETYKADKMCFSEPSWCQMKNLQNRSIWPEVNEGFSRVSSLHLYPMCGRFPYPAAHADFS